MVVMLIPSDFSPEQQAALRLGDEISRCHHRLVSLLEQLHGDMAVPASSRAVLRLLVARDVLTVPEIARERAVSRQFVQKIVNGLIAQGYVATARNPKSRKSPLLTITEEGQRLLRTMYAREAQLLSRAVEDTDTTVAALDACRATLETLRGSMDAMLGDAGVRR